MVGSQNNQIYSQNQILDQNNQTIEVGSEDSLPVFSPLKGGFQPAQRPNENFDQQFSLPWPVIPPKAFDPHIYLPKYTYQRIDFQSLNIFNPDAGFYNKKSETQVKIRKEKAKIKEKPHYYNLMKATYTKKGKETGNFAQLNPVPIIKLNKKEVSYTQTVNNIISFSPTSKGTFKATDAMLGLVIGFVLFFIYLRTVFGKQVRIFYRSAYNRVRAVNVYEERGIITGRVSFALNIFYFLVLGMLGMHIMDHTGYEVRGVNPIALFFLLTGLILTTYILKYLFGRLIGHLMQFNEYAAAFFFHTFIFNKTYAIFIFPFLLVVPYIDSNWALMLMQGAIVLYGVFYVLRSLRIFMLSVQRNISIFYLFLYLCALEFVPILVILKIATGWLKLSVF